MALPRRSAYALTAVTVAQLAAAVTLLILAPEPVDVVTAAVAMPIALLAAALGTLVATRRPDNLVAPLLVLFGAVIAWQGLDHEYGVVVAHRPGLLPVFDLYVGFTGVWAFLYVPTALLMVYFPDRRLLGRRWRWLVAGLIGVPTLATLLSGFDQGHKPPPFQDLPSPFTPPPQPWYTASRCSLRY